MILRLLLTWDTPPSSRKVLALLNGYRNTPEPVLVHTSENYTGGTVLALDQNTDIVYPELTLLPFSQNLAQVAVKTLVPRTGIPIGSVYPLIGYDLQTIEDYWGASPLSLQRAQNKTSLLLLGGTTVPLNYYSIVAQTSGVPNRVDFTNQTLVTVIHMLGKHPDVQIFDSSGNNIIGNLVPTTNDRFDVTFNPPATGYLLY
jgi:hypothetical protein